jgi:hypothetical protein
VWGVDPWYCWRWSVCELLFVVLGDTVGELCSLQCWAIQCASWVVCSVGRYIGRVV